MSASQGAAPRIDVQQVIYALQRAERQLQHAADVLHDQHDYGAEFPFEDAERMREAVTICREREVLARWMAEACGVLASVEEEAEDGGESLRMLRERGLRLVRAVLGPPPIEAAPNGPQCNLNTPWLAP